MGISSKIIIFGMLGISQCAFSNDVRVDPGVKKYFYEHPVEAAKKIDQVIWKSGLKYSGEDLQKSLKSAINDLEKFYKNSNWENHTSACLSIHESQSEAFNLREKVEFDFKGEKIKDIDHNSELLKLGWKLDYTLGLVHKYLECE